LLALVACLLVPASASAFALESGGVFQFKGSNGYSLLGYAFPGSDGSQGNVFLLVAKKGEGVTYSAPATVTADAIHADLGALGRIGVVFRGSGQKKTVKAPCVGTRVSYEQGIYEGRFELDGEEGYTRMREERFPRLVLPLLKAICAEAGGGEGEVGGGPEMPGARLKGSSFADGRRLAFQINKNGPGKKVQYDVELRERHGSVLIQRGVEGVAPSRAFLYDRRLRGATLGPPTPFSGSASLSRRPNWVVPVWRGDLAVDFPGRSNVPLTGPRVLVGIAHARLIGNGPHVKAGFAAPARGLLRWFR